MKDIVVRIPVTYVNDVLKIKALRLSGTGWPKEEAFKNILKETPEHYAMLYAGEIKEEGKYIGLYLPYSDKLLKLIYENELLPKDKEKAKKKESSNLKSANAEEVVKYGY